jgi:hypothetical protein
MLDMVNSKSITFKGEKNGKKEKLSSTIKTNTCGCMQSFAIFMHWVNQKRVDLIQMVPSSLSSTVKWKAQCGRITRSWDFGDFNL